MHLMRHRLWNPDDTVDPIPRAVLEEHDDAWLVEEQPSCEVVTHPRPRPVRRPSNGVRMLFPGSAWRPSRGRKADLGPGAWRHPGTTHLGSRALSVACLVGEERLEKNVLEPLLCLHVQDWARSEMGRTKRLGIQPADGGGWLYAGRVRSGVSRPIRGNGVGGDCGDGTPAVPPASAQRPDVVIAGATRCDGSRCRLRSSRSPGARTAEMWPHMVLHTPTPRPCVCLELTVARNARRRFGWREREQTDKGRGGLVKVPLCPRARGTLGCATDLCSVPLSE